MAMQAPVVASIQQESIGFVQHWVIPMIQVPAWDAHAYYQASQAVQFGDRVWMGAPKAHTAQWQRGGHLVADSHFSCAQSDGESTTAPSSPRSGPGSGHVPANSDNCSLSPALSSIGTPWQRQPSMLEPHPSLGHHPNAPAFALPADAEAHVSVVLSGLPKMLCSTKCLEVAIEQACYESDVVTFEVKSTRGVGEAVVILRSESAAQRCIRHFTALRCARSSPIVARYNAEAGRCLMARRNGVHSVIDESPSQEPEASKVDPDLRKKTRKPKTPNQQCVLELDTVAIRKTEGEFAAPSLPRELVTCEEVAKAPASTKDMVVDRPPVTRSPTLSVIGSPMRAKKLWADYDDDDEDEDGFFLDNQSTLAPPESEASVFWNSDTEAL